MNVNVIKKLKVIKVTFSISPEGDRSILVSAFQISESFSLSVQQEIKTAISPKTSAC